MRSAPEDNTRRHAPSVGKAALVMVALQWYVVAAGLVVVLGNAAARLQGLDAGEHLGSIQRLFVISGLVTTAQVLLGHRLPILAGPSAILLAGLALSGREAAPAVFTAIAVFGFVVTVLSMAGLQARMRHWFTTSVAAVVLLLVGASLVPTALHLAEQGPCGPWFGWLSAAVILAASLAGQRWLPPAWRGAALPAAMVLGAAVVLFLAPGSGGVQPLVGAFGQIIPDVPSFVFDPVAWVTIGCCFVGLMGNDLGSLAAMEPVLRPGAGFDLRRSPRAGLWTGAGNIVSGLVGIIGPVNYALSAGIVQGTGCVRRTPLVAAGLLLVVTGLLGDLVAFAVRLPSPVIGGALSVIIVGQVKAAAVVIRQPGLRRVGGRSVLLPVALGVGVMALPDSWLLGLPGPVQALMGNGFLVGLAAALLMARFRRRLLGSGSP